MSAADHCFGYVKNKEPAGLAAGSDGGQRSGGGENAGLVGGREEKPPKARD
jgi:hypothetical protein